jgi:hypothetical protein
LCLKTSVIRSHLSITGPATSYDGITRTNRGGDRRPSCSPKMRGFGVSPNPPQNGRKWNNYLSRKKNRHFCSAGPMGTTSTVLSRWSIWAP